MPSWDEIAAFYPAWISLTIGVLLVFNKLAEESEKVANRLGRLGRWMRRRALERHHVDIKAAEFANAVQAAVQNAVNEAREEWEADENEAIASLNRRLKTVSDITNKQDRDINKQDRDIRGLRQQVACLTAYTEYEDLWHSQLRAAAVRSGAGTILTAELPNHMGFYDFEANYKTDRNWRKWI